MYHELRKRGTGRIRSKSMVKVCDCFPEVKLTSIGALNELVECKKSGHKFIISEPVHVGGQNVAPTPLEFMLAGAVGCYAAVFAFYAAKLGVDYESFEATARADFDVRGHMIEGAPSSA